MSNLFKKTQILQFIIIFLLNSFNNSNNEKPTILTEYNTFLSDIVEYNDIIKNHLKDKYDIFLQKNEYFYIFENDNNINAYFFKEKNSDNHNIYFNGINNPIDIFLNDYTYKNVENILNKNGTMYTFANNDICEINNKEDDINILNVFDYLYGNVYNKNSYIHINGYSLGGPLSQVFTLLLIDKYSDITNNITIKNYNIESWFFGNENEYNKFKKSVKLLNIYNPKSILYLYNNLFQKYNKTDYFINNKNKFDYDEYIFKNCPFGIIKYINDNHLLSNIIS
jgi:hypothetical protein